MDDKTVETYPVLNQRVATSDGDLVSAARIVKTQCISAAGGGSDVFVSGGMNIVFGFGDAVKFNDTI
ncbi:MAG: hypothetical protein IPM98_15850 [Lewinellaceae bacterium]|nr:hypothetical protein [Lewinellaceae bacterium]